MRIGVFGGTFDPVHLGHLIVAEQAREQAKLDRVLFIPAPRPPHKQNSEITALARRVEMLELAIAGQTSFVVDEMEKDRPGPSYTVDTLEELRRRSPSDELFLLIGSDSLSELTQWRSPDRIRELATLLVVARPGWELEQDQRRSGHWQWVEAPLIEISSRDLRQRAADGRSLRYLVPPAVECYIVQHRLYREEPPSG